MATQGLGPMLPTEGSSPQETAGKGTQKVKNKELGLISAGKRVIKDIKVAFKVANAMAKGQEFQVMRDLNLSSTQASPKATLVLDDTQLKETSEKTEDVAFNSLEKFVHIFSESKAKEMRGKRVEGLITKLNMHLDQGNAMKAVNSFNRLLSASPSDAKQISPKMEKPLKELSITDTKKYANHIAKFIKNDPEMGHKLLWDTGQEHTCDHDLLTKRLASKLSQRELVDVIKYTTKEQIHSHNEKADNLLRSNSLSSKLLRQFSDTYMKPDFKKHFLKMMKEMPDEKIEGYDQSQINKLIDKDKQHLIEDQAKQILNGMVEYTNNNDSKSLKLFKEICDDARNVINADDQYGPPNGEIVAGNFFFLRVANPMLSAPNDPSTFGLNYTDNQANNAMIVSKIIQNLANNIEFGNKEQHMIVFNDLIRAQKKQLGEIREHVLPNN